MAVGERISRGGTVCFVGERERAPGSKSPREGCGIGVRPESCWILGLGGNRRRPTVRANDQGGPSLRTPVLHQDSLAAARLATITLRVHRSPLRFVDSQTF